MTSPRSVRRRTMASLTTLLLAVGLAACGSDRTEGPARAGPSTGSPGSTSSAEDSVDAEDGEETDDAEDSEDSDGAEDSEDTAGTATSGSADAEGTITVTSEGKGVMILRVTDDGSVEGEESPLSGKLVSGPGGCLALQSGGRPELLIFDDEVELLVSPPRISLDGAEVKVGEELTTTATMVSAAQVQGIPDRCAKGPSETAWLVDD